MADHLSSSPWKLHFSTHSNANLWPSLDDVWQPAHGWTAVSLLNLWLCFSADCAGWVPTTTITGKTLCVDLRRSCLRYLVIRLYLHDQTASPASEELGHMGWVVKWELVWLQFTLRHPKDPLLLLYRHALWFLGYGAIFKNVKLILKEKAVLYCNCELSRIKDLVKYPTLLHPWTLYIRSEVPPFLFDQSPSVYVLPRLSPLHSSVRLK